MQALLLSLLSLSFYADDIDTLIQAGQKGLDQVISNRLDRLKVIEERMEANIRSANGRDRETLQKELLEFRLKNSEYAKVEMPWRMVGMQIDEYSQIGDFGTIENVDMRVEKVIDRKNGVIQQYFVKTGYRERDGKLEAYEKKVRGNDFWIRNFDFTKYENGADYFENNKDRVYRVVGTKEWDNGKRTVKTLIVVEPYVPLNLYRQIRDRGYTV